jgi:flagellin
LTTGAGSTSTTSQSTVSDAATMAQLQAQFTADAADTTPVSYSTPTATYGQNAVFEDATNQALTVQSMALDGTVTTTTYTALDANGNTLAQEGTGGTLTFANAASYAVNTTVTTPGSQNLLVQNGLDLTTISITGGSDAQTALTAVNQALSAVTNYAALIGATQDRMTSANTFNTALMTNYANGVSGMVDADMNTASTQLQALQTQEQLGIQSLSIANQNAQLILKLFQ